MLPGRTSDPPREPALGPSCTPQPVLARKSGDTSGGGVAGSLPEASQSLQTGPIVPPFCLSPSANYRGLAEKEDVLFGAT